MLSEDTEYGRTIRDGFVSTFGKPGTVDHQLVVSADPTDAAVAALRANPSSGPIVVAGQESHGLEVIVALRRAA
ncbi:hypothetical protein SAMN04488074_102559 [Lentzea albidocapillata subsp. violacea]|uniref:Uncharacterized protein n=1 Tax=Lentzea albidocapillata subsp. violacea TaxID=128104 RepID=A0A1G8V9C2_9PSEU|nr:hypothetical protein [Lentzea albidocapillata]SDJ62716.1 hypothetical protein SAMN04488074_102559 [Lentzea albidocapillata subsp. violacea]